ncbi:MAG TPA: ATP-binding protein [Dokdonella sp.]|uniref:sensor histidine kinase n=1 Tax=Dokdonella sp. TaxID=2291710 RepID=UPI002D7FA648|nr:ATP-binding protein [Dokdonella sp.]HET9033150.1 ATP-binding protein [Dokdonella sp.]
MRARFHSGLHRIVLIYGCLLLIAFGVVGAVSFWAFDHLLERDIEQAVTLEYQALMEVYRSDGRSGLIRTIAERSQSPNNRDAVYLLIAPSGKVLAGRRKELTVKLPSRGGWIRYPSRDAPESDEVLAFAHQLRGGGWLVTGRTTGAQERLRELITRLGAVSLALLALLSVLLGWLLRRSINRSLLASLDTVDRVATGHLDERVPERPGNDGFARLGRTLNRMLDRIQDLVGGIQHSTDAIAHDLRTPLMRLKARLEAIEADSAGEASQRNLDAAIAEIDQLVATFNSLLRLARIEATQTAPMEAIALDAVVNDAAELWQALAETKSQHLLMRVARASIVGDRDLLFQMVSNLLDNAIKYAGEDSDISVTLTREGDEAVLVISDQGPGIADDQRERVFDRFVRLEQHRGTVGSGLGLSVVRAIAIRHGADLRLESARPGLRVRLAFALPQH